MANAEVYVRDLAGKIHFISKKISEVYRQRGYRVLNQRPNLDINSLNKEIEEKLRNDKEALDANK
jgi:hypothetical protein